MTAFVTSMIEATIGKEGGYSNHPADKGGETMWGITERVARKHGYRGAMRELPRTTAVRIYTDEYWVDPGFDRVASIMPVVAEELFDTGVNLGSAVAALWLQMCLNAFNRQGLLYADIREDTDIGPATLRALEAYAAARKEDGSRVMLKALNGLQAARYIDLSRSRQANEAFVYGWLKNRVEFGGGFAGVGR